MSALVNNTVGDRPKGESMVDDVAQVVCQDPSIVLRFDLILQLILSHLEFKDLLSSRLVSKQWHALGTEEVQGRKRTVLWIGHLDEGRSRLDEASINSFISLMDASPLIPVVQIGLRIDPFLVDPPHIIRLLTYIAPWVSVLRLRFLSSSYLPFLPLSGEERRKAMSWTQELDDWRGIQFPNLRYLEVGDTGDTSYMTLHRILATSMSVLVKRLVHGSMSLKSLLFRTPLFGCDQDMEEVERVAMMGITKVLPPSLRSLGFERRVQVDYESLTAVKPKLEELIGKGSSESKEAFLKFLEVQKSTLTRLVLPDLENIYGKASRSYLS